MELGAGDVTLRPAARVHVFLWALRLPHLDAPRGQTFLFSRIREIKHARLFLLSRSQPPLGFLLP